MSALVADFIRAAAQLSDPRFRRVFVLSILLTAALLAALYLLWSMAVAAIPDMRFTLFGAEIGFLDEAARWLAWAAGLVGLAFLMFPAASLFIGFFLEEIAAAVEARHYPHLPPAKPLGLLETIWDGVLFTLTLLGANAAALLVYLISGPLAPFVFLAVNGYLLGRQYFELAAARRIGFRAARRLRRRHLARVWAGGAMLAVPLTVPIVSLAVPVLGVAAFTHQFHRLNGDASAPPDA
ncbi:EI24 domain-containing protein [Oceanicella actignis]|uniref:Uncharacterized protein involved in cysteine biosynthesis n=1 Tax=Oceanicella actignis TaxID=1189325 RepID=A0A1M7RT18_9RHOB|nr:EI24 domain-containing protein [Oceanicella actignis]SET04936.1 Uncharacterized protein involved in cysteine biosynthesis [Oceanicella actignis]SHN49435.1 Uncharacterized protein involved in cysteine biosynthesis [Oceanicella actignis]